MFRTTRFLVGVLVLLLLPCLASASDIVYLVRTGTDSEGNPLFRPASSQDTYLYSLFEITRNSTSLNEAARFYDATQKNQVAAALQAQGYSSQQVQTALQNYQAEPVFIEVSNSSGGSYNDWKGKFTVQWGNGQTYTYSSPRVVYALGSDVARSGDKSLIQQTLVHEVAHGVMSKAMTTSSLPETPWLSKAHSGGSVTDEKLAFIEGWAEFIGAYFTGRLTIAGDPSNALNSNWYGTSNNSYKSINTLRSTEGWNATILYHIATQGKDQNAMWKMTQVMAKTRPQTTMQLLNNLAASYPELSGTINKVLYQDSGGQAGSATSGTQYANYNAYTSNNGYGTGTGSGTGSGSLESIWYGNNNGGQSGQSAYTTYNQYRNYQNSLAGTTITDPNQLASIAQQTSQLEAAYVQKKQQLDSLPWYSFIKRSQVKNELSMIYDLYCRQVQLQESIMAGGSSGYAAQAQSTPAAASGGPIDNKQTYNGLVSSVSSNDSAAAMATLKAYQELNERRKAQRANGPKGER